MPIRVKSALVILIFAGVLLRFHGFFFNTFHSDEALFAYWSRLIATGRDPLLLHQMVDKPPLLFYLQAIFYPILGPVELVARIPNFAASIISIPATGVLAWRLFRQELASVLAAAFITFSPLAIQFSGTAFTDPLLTFWLTLSLVATSHNVSHRFFIDTDVAWKRSRVADRNALLAGIFFGLALATKFQAWLFLPLVISLALVGSWQRRQWRRWLVGLLSCLLIVFLWELLRGSGPTLASQQLSSFGGIRVSYSWELWPRVAAWAEQWRYVLRSEILSFIVILSLPLYLALIIHDDDKSTVIDQILTLFVIGYFVVHWFLAIPAWDRYILPLLPLVGIVLARYILRVINFVLDELPETARYKTRLNQLFWIIPLTLLVFQGQGILDAYEGRLPIGGQPDADQGVSAAVEMLSETPYGSVLYDHWYSWQLRYYLFDSRTFISWFPDNDSLQQDLLVFGRDGNPRYILLPTDGIANPTARSIEEAGFSLTNMDIDQMHSRSQESSVALFLIEPR